MELWVFLGLGVSGLLLILWIVRMRRKATPYFLGGFLGTALLIPFLKVWAHMEVRYWKEILLQMGAYAAPICIATLLILVLANFGNLRKRAK
jgi:hypothetical protein